MRLDGKGPQMTRQLELPNSNRGETPTGKRSEEAPTAMHENERSGASGLMEKVCERPNLQVALKRVRKNKGSPGIDGMTVDELPDRSPPPETLGTTIDRLPRATRPRHVQGRSYGRGRELSPLVDELG